MTVAAALRRTHLRGELWLGAGRRGGRGVAGRASHTNVVITDRNAAPELIDLADTVTEMRKLKHAYDQGIRSRKGIEY